MPLAFHAPAPALWSTVPANQVDVSAFLGSDDCVIGDHYFVRGLIRIPITDRSDWFEWGVWVSLSRENFERTVSLWTQPGREGEPPYFGWLSTELAPLYPSTLNLKTMVHTQPVGLRPHIEVETTDHPLAREQRTGITIERVHEIARTILHRESHPASAGPAD